jgi:hypothetical protein
MASSSGLTRSMAAGSPAARTFSLPAAATARELEQAHADTGIAYIAAPVMGRPDD